METRTGFAVIYRWRVKPGLEAQCREGWARVTERYLAERGALGSRLHETPDGLWVAYAQWPDRAAWERSRALPPVEESALMQSAIDETESFPPILLEPILDYLKPTGIAPRE